MLSEEEKKAIEIVKNNPKTILDLINLDENLLDKVSEFNYSVEEVKDWACKILLNLITKLQKETKEKDEEIKFWKEQAESYQGLSHQIKEDYNTYFNLGE